jgi:hypothetical protein
MKIDIDVNREIFVAKGRKEGSILQIISKSEWVEGVLSATGKISDEFPNLIKSAKDYKKVLFELQQIQESNSTKLDQRFAAEAARITAAAMADFRKTNKMSVEQFNVITKEKEIAQRGFQDQIDTYNEGIGSIEKLEQSVNDKYDAKIKLIGEQVTALDKVRSINEDIAAQQQNQLTLADALTQGDISAAASAAADYSAQQAEVASRSASEALDEQQRALEIKRQKDVDAITTTVNGKLYTRKQLAEAITKLQEESIAPLEKEIETRNRLVQAYEDANTKALANVEINKLTSTEWDAIKSAVGLLNEAYDAQVLNIDEIATSVGGVEGAWTAVSTAIKNAALELGKYPVFGDQAAKDKAAAEAKAKADKDAADAKAKAEAEQKRIEAEAIAKANAPLTYNQQREAQIKATAEEKRKLEAAADAAAQSASPAASANALRKLQSGQALTAIEKKLLSIGLANGGFVPQYMASGGFSIGTDTVPAMLTPGEFVVRKSVADQYGPLLESLNNGTYKSFEAPTYSNMNNSAVKVGTGSSNTPSDNSSKVYNYNVGISVSNTNASPDDIAKVVMAEIKYIDSQRLRGQR